MIISATTSVGVSAYAVLVEPGPRFVIHTSDVPVVDKQADKHCGHKDVHVRRVLDKGYSP